MIDPRTPCLVGVAQRTWRLEGDEQAPEPLAMQVEMVRAAALDASASRGSDAVLAAAESLSVVNCLSWAYDEPVDRLAEALAMSPSHRHSSTMSGTTPQTLVGNAAMRMLAGELDVAVIVGAEALDTKRRLKKAGERPEWSHPAQRRPPLDPSITFLPSEIPHEVFQAWLTFAVRDIARRAARGDQPNDHRDSIGALMAPMTHVAAANPHAWFRRVRTASELVTPSPDNRFVGYPYTKHTVAMMDVDMASAVIVATHGAADRLGIPADRRVYLRGWAAADDATYLAEHPDLARSPAMRWAFEEALRGAGVGIDDVAYLDLYSCFASSLSFARDALGLSGATDERGVTVTGGLPFSGGPASNYMTHALATMVDRLRQDPASTGLVNGVGMHMTHHVAGVYSTTPGPVVAPAPPPAAERRSVVDSHSGAAVVAAYSVVHGRSGEAEWALVVGDVGDRARCYGRVEAPELLAAMEKDEWVGRTVTFTACDDLVNRITA